MKLQQDEEIIHEMRPAGAILAIWFFSKCLLPGFVGAFFAFTCPGFIGSILAAAARSDYTWPIVTCLIVAPLVGAVVWVLALIQ